MDWLQKYGFKMRDRVTLNIKFHHTGLVGIIAGVDYPLVVFQMDNGSVTLVLIEHLRKI